MNRSDDLNRTGSVPLGGSTPSDGLGNWDDLFSSFSTASDGGGNIVAFESANHGNPGNIARLDAGTPDARCTAEVTRIDGQVAATARVQDDGSCYFFMSDVAGATSLWKVSAPASFTQLASGTLSFTPGVGHTLGCEAVGSIIKGYVNGVECTGGGVTDTTFAAGNEHGIRTSGQFNFVNSVAVTDLSSSPPPPPPALFWPGFAPGF